MLGNPLNLFMMSDNDVEILGLIAKKYAQDVVINMDTTYI